MEVQIQQDITPATKYARRMHRVINYIRHNLQADLSLATLAKVAHFSPFHFHRQFSSFAGVSTAYFVRILRLQQASLRLAFVPTMSLSDIAAEANYQSTEAFTRAFRRHHPQSPNAFRKQPQWQPWQRENPLKIRENYVHQKVKIINFPTTKVAAVEYTGPEHRSLLATRKLIDWRRENRVPPSQGNTYGVHYSDPASTPPEEYRMDVCVSYEREIKPNNYDVVAKTIPGGRCATLRHFGSRNHIPGAQFLYREWLPQSGEELRDFPIYFHYVNVGPDVMDANMVTDLYLPIL